MAAALATKILPHVHADSAGIAPYPERAAHEAITIMREFGIDISGHRSKSVDSLPIGTFDLIVAMDPLVYRNVRERYQVSADKLIPWDVEDPVGKEVEIYRQCARAIERLIPSLAARLEMAERPALNTEGHEAKVQEQDDLEKLLVSISRWRADLEDPRSRGTLLIGIAGKAATSFEELLRGLLFAYCKACSISLERTLSEEFASLNPAKLTLGQIITVLVELNGRFTECLRSMGSFGLLLAERPLMTTGEIDRLREIRDLRNSLTHRLNPYVLEAETEAKKATQRLLILVEQALGDQVFRVGTAVSKMRP